MFIKKNVLGNFFIKRIVIVIFGGLFLFSSSAYAQDLLSSIKELEKVLAEEEATKNLSWVKDLKLHMKYLKEKENELRQLVLSFGAGYTGNKAGETSLYKLDVNAKAEKTIYPFAFRFSAGTIVQYENDKLKEDVTSLILNFDYYIASWLESFVFLDRFSDKYLSIKERYEIGAGIKFELDLFNKKQDSCCVPSDKMEEIYKKLRTYLCDPERRKNNEEFDPDQVLNRSLRDKVFLQV